MKKAFSVILCILWLVLPFHGFGSKPEKESSKSPSAIELNVQKLIEHAGNSMFLLNNPRLGDSLYSQAILLAQTSYDHPLILRTMNAWFEGMEGSMYIEKRLAAVAEAQRIVQSLNDNELASETYINIAGIYRSAYNFEKALEYSYKAFNVAELSGKSSLKAESYISIGKSMEGKNQLLEAFRNYLQAMNIGENKEDEAVLDHACKAISRFYHLNKDFDNAIKFKLKQIDLLKQSHPVDSLAYMWLQFELEEISYNAKKTVNEYNLERLLAFAKQHHNPRLNEFILTLYRSYLIHTEQLAKLKNFYQQRYPHELQKMKSDNPAMYYRIQALLYEHDNNMEVASQNWMISESLITNDPNKVFKANFYIRYGQFLVRSGNIPLAILKFKTALEMSNEAGYIQYAHDAAGELENAYVKSEDYKNAHFYSKIHLLLTDSMVSISQKEDVLKLEISNTANQREELVKKEEMETERRHNLQYSAIVIIMGIIFLILVLLGSFKVPAWSIKMLGFISFILLFEFIILLADQKIHHATHGEPWKILALKIVLIGIMMPLHHWTEHKVIHYLIHKKVVTFNNNAIRRFFSSLFTRTKPPEV
jgi:tetratricopeptide (TPR) repeat protein